MFSNYSFIFTIIFIYIMSFARLDGIAVPSLIKAIKYTVLYLCHFVRFSNAFLLQIKVL